MIVCLTCTSCGHEEDRAVTRVIPLEKTVVCPVCGEDSMGRDIGREHCRTGSNKQWPLHDLAAGFHPKQAGEVFKKTSELGFPTRLDHQGAAILESREHRRKYHRWRRLFDRDAGYSDAVPD